jgi:hypothetical protein
MSRKHHAIYSDPTGAAAAANPVKRRTTRSKVSASVGPEISSSELVGTARHEPVVDRETIARLAYSYWEARGYAGGSPEEDWLRAEQELRHGRAASATA